MNASYRVSHIEGYSGTDHFGREIAARCKSTYRTLAAARAALREARAGHQHGQHSPGRFDILRSDGKRFEWE